MPGLHRCSERKGATAHRNAADKGREEMVRYLAAERGACVVDECISHGGLFGCRRHLAHEMRKALQCADHGGGDRRVLHCRVILGRPCCTQDALKDLHTTRHMTTTIRPLPTQAGFAGAPLPPKFTGSFSCAGLSLREPGTQIHDGNALHMLDS